MALAKGLLSKIHIARQQVEMEEDIYRQKLQDMFGKTSAKDLSLRQAEKLLEEFKRLGWKPQPSKRTVGRPHNFASPAMPELITKIEAQLADMKLPWAYADALARQMYKIQRVTWLRKPEQLTGLIAALHVEQEKRNLLAEVERLCQRLGIEHPEQVSGLEQLPKDWKRQRPILKALVDTLNAVWEAREQKEGV